MIEHNLAIYYLFYVDDSIIGGFKDLQREQSHSVRWSFGLLLLWQLYTRDCQQTGRLLLQMLLCTKSSLDCGWTWASWLVSWQGLNEPWKTHCHAALRILWYLRATQDWGIFCMASDNMETFSFSDGRTQIGRVRSTHVNLLAVTVSLLVHVLSLGAERINPRWSF